MTHLQQFDIDNHEIFGFRPKIFTVHQLLRLVEFLHDGFEYSGMIGTFFIDVTKASETVWKSNLNYKLLELKIPNSNVQFTFPYFRSRTSIFSRANKFSTPRPVNAGVTHGSQLDSCLYKIHKDRIPRSQRI